MIILLIGTDLDHLPVEFTSISSNSNPVKIYSEVMKLPIRLFIAMCLLLSALYYTGCYSDQFEPEPIIIDPVDTISFSNEIVPIFVTSCNLSICHASGAVPPNLTPANAYNSLVSGGYVDTDNPTASEFYLWLTGDGDRDIMPPTGRNEDLIELVLGWMQQGALNN